MRKSTFLAPSTGINVGVIILFLVYIHKCLPTGAIVTVTVVNVYNTFLSRKEVTQHILLMLAVSSHSMAARGDIVAQNLSMHHKWLPFNTLLTSIPSFDYRKWL